MKFEADIRLHEALLRRMGFAVDYYDRPSKQNPGLKQYSKFCTRKRKVEVQLWGKGQHRATNMLFSDKARTMGRMSTQPTYFCTAEEMCKAIDREIHRGDHPRRNYQASPRQRATSSYWQIQGEIKRTFALFTNFCTKYGLGALLSQLPGYEHQLLAEEKQRYEFAKVKLPAKEKPARKKDLTPAVN